MFLALGECMFIKKPILNKNFNFKNYKQTKIPIITQKIYHLQDSSVTAPPEPLLGGFRYRYP